MAVKSNQNYGRLKSDRQINKVYCTHEIKGSMHNWVSYSLRPAVLRYGRISVCSLINNY